MTKPTDKSFNMNEKLGPDYVAQADSWEKDRFGSMRLQMKLSWALTGVFGCVALLALVALVALLPLKQFEPYLVVQDKSTGYLEVAQKLDPKGLSENEAVMASNVVRYLRARETYNPSMLKSDFDLAQLYSADQASKDLTWAFSPSNPKSLSKVYGQDTLVSVYVKSVSFLNKSTASVRFSTRRVRDNTETNEDWVGVLRFRVTQAPLKNQHRFDNPMGFQVTEYRRDQEATVTTGSLK